MAFAKLADLEFAVGGNGTNFLPSAAIDTTGADLLAIVASWYPVDVPNPTLSDSAGNTWTGLTAATSGSSKARIFYVLNPTTSASHTFQFDGFGIFSACTAMAFSGAAAASTFDQENGATGTSATSLAAGSITPTETDELIIAGVSTSPGTAHSIGSGFTLDQSADNTSSQNLGMGAAYLIQTSAAAVNPSWSWTSSAEASAVIASFKAASGTGGGGGGSVVIPPPLLIGAI